MIFHHIVGILREKEIDFIFWYFMIKYYETYDDNDFRCNFSDLEIEMFFAKYDVDGDGIFSWDEGAQVSSFSIFPLVFLTILYIIICLFLNMTLYLSIRSVFYLSLSFPWLSFPYYSFIIILLFLNMPLYL